MRSIAQLLLAFALALLLRTEANAHGGTYVAPGAENIARPLAMLLGSNWNFSATAKCRMDDTHHPGEFLEWEMPVAARDGRLRAELELGAIKGEPPLLPAEEIQRQRAWKVAKTVSVLRPDAPTDLLLYPDFQAYVELMRSDEDLRRAKALRTVKRRDLGDELIDGRPCVKRQVLITAEGESAAVGFTTWEAADPPRFPFQVRFHTEDGTVTIRFRDVRFTPPDASQFEPPEAFRRFDSVMELHRAAGKQHQPPGRQP